MSYFQIQTLDSCVVAYNSLLLVKFPQIIDNQRRLINLADLGDHLPLCLRQWVFFMVVKVLLELLIFLRFAKTNLVSFRYKPIQFDEREENAPTDSKLLR